jgi:hypothetical protein
MESRIAADNPWHLTKLELGNDDFNSPQISRDKCLGDLLYKISGTMFYDPSGHAEAEYARANTPG